MRDLNKEKQKKTVIEAIIVTILVAIVIFLIVLLTYKKETQIIEEYEDEDVMSLTCKTHDNDSSFFSTDQTNDLTHTLKLVYVGSQLKKLAYEYDGVYSSAELAKKDSGSLHTRYNLYLGDHGVKHELLNPVFQFDENHARIRLYLDDYSKMNSVVSKIFYIGNGMIDTIGKNSIDETKKIYENRGFSCIISD